MGSCSELRSTVGWAARDPSGVLSPYSYTLRNVGGEDVMLKVLFCSLCHTDLHLARNDIGTSKYPMVPGHEVVGEVVEAGGGVSKVKPGDVVGVGLIVGCCRSCGPCEPGEEQYCKKMVWSYNDVDADGRPTQGGFAASMVVDQKFVVKIPPNLPPEQAALLLCAGITAYSPLRHLGLKAHGLRGAVLGLGGVGHTGVKMAKAMGHHVTVISSSDRKREEALAHLGADAYLVSSNEAAMAAAADSLDYIIDTVPSVHALESYLSLLRQDGKLIIVGLVDQPVQFLPTTVLLGRKRIVGSFIGSMEDMKEMMEFCGDKGVTTMIEVVQMNYVNSAMERLEKNDVRYRFVVDVAGSKLCHG